MHEQKQKPASRQQHLRRHNTISNTFASHIDMLGGTVHDALVLLDQDLRIVSTNGAFWRLLGINPEHSQGLALYELVGRQLDAPRLQQLLEEVLLSDTPVNDFEMAVEVDGSQPGSLLINACALNLERPYKFVILAIKEVAQRGTAQPQVGEPQTLLSLRDQAEKDLLHLKAELEREVNGLTRLRKISSTLWRTHDLASGLEEMLRATIEIMGADFGNIQLLDPDRQVLTIAAHQGFAPEFLEAFRAVDVTDGCACGRALRSRTRLLIEDVEVDDAYAPYKAIASKNGYRAVQSTPLLSPDGEPLGMLSTFWRLQHLPTQQELARLDLFVQLAAEYVWRNRVDQQLRERDALVTSIFDTAADAIITLDEHNLIVRVNAATERMFGFKALALVGQSVSLLMPAVTSQELRAILNQQSKIGLREHAVNKREFLGVRNGGISFPLELSVSEVDHLKIYAIIVRDITDRCRLQREVATIAESEQRKIGQELHDSLQQELTAVSLLASVLLDHLNGLSTGVSQTPLKRCAEVAEKILSGVKRANEDVRQISHGLMPVQLDSEGLVNALHQLALQTDALKSVTCTFSSSGPVEIAEAFTATHLFKIAQEAVTNCLKHAHAKHIGIELETEESAIVLRVFDDGVGVNGQYARGVGLRSMEYRAHLINGILRLTNRTQGGALLTCTVFNRDSRYCGPAVEESGSQLV